MKYTKQLLFIMILTLFGINKIYADTCYYTNIDQRVLLTYDTTTQRFAINKIDNKVVGLSGTTNTTQKVNLANNNKEVKDRKTGITIAAIDGKQCPKYVSFKYDTSFFGTSKVYGFNDKNTANEFSMATNDLNKKKIDAWTLEPTQVTEEEFDEMVENNEAYTKQDVSCDGIFGSKDDPDSLRYLFNEIMMYPKIIVPILVIALGILDLAKAVTAASEDVMKKAQKTFVKRLLISIAIFFVPTIMNVIMYLADLVWNGAFTTCGL